MTLPSNLLGLTRNPVPVAPVCQEASAARNPPGLLCLELPRNRPRICALREWDAIRGKIVSSTLISLIVVEAGILTACLIGYGLWY